MDTDKQHRQNTNPYNSGGGGFDVEELTDKPDEHGGFGLAVIESLVDEVIVDSTVSGTRLKMIRRGTPPE